MKTGVIIQARTSSTRLPKKILLDLPMGSGINVLQHVIRRVKHCKNIDELIVATSTEVEDEEIVKIAKKEQIQSFQGDLYNLISRYYFAAKKFKLDIIVRITSDCPCIDPYIIDLLIENHIKNKVDYSSTSTDDQRSFPHGLDVEVLNFTTLEKIYNEVQDKDDKEHVGTYIRKTKPSDFSIYSLKASDEYYAPDIRITLDTEEDYLVLCAVYDFLYNEIKIFKTKDIIRIFEKHPWLKFINKKILQKKTTKSFDEEKKEAIRLLELQGLHRIKDFLDSHG